MGAGMKAPTIIEFLLARIAEVEAGAKRAAFGWGAEWKSAPDAHGEWFFVNADAKHGLVDSEDADVINHIATQDPARILRECEAKRAIVALHRGEKWNIPPVPDPDGAEYVHTHDGIEMRFGGASWLITFEEYASRVGATLLPPAAELRHLAAAYSDHPDYQDAWAL